MSVVCSPNGLYDIDVLKKHINVGHIQLNSKHSKKAWKTLSTSKARSRQPACLTFLWVRPFYRDGVHGSPVRLVVAPGSVFVCIWASLQLLSAAPLTSAFPGTLDLNTRNILLLCGPHQLFATVWSTYLICQLCWESCGMLSCCCWTAGWCSPGLCFPAPSCVF